MAELKPCPFCGSTHISCADAGHKTNVWFVQCEDCGATFPHFDTKAEAIDTWNGRVEVKHGEWKDNGDRDSNGVAKPFAISCSVCGSSAGTSWMNYCPNCGAKMDKKEGAEE